MALEVKKFDTFKINTSRSELLCSQYLNETTADVFFICNVEAVNDDNEKEKVPAHKIILASLSNVFQRMFYGNIAEGNEIEIADVTAGGLKQFLRLFYKEEVVCSVQHVPEMLYLAEKYDVPDCLFACSKFIIENGTQVFQTANFLKCPQDILRTILQCMFLKGEGQLLFKACVDWSTNACSLIGLDGTEMKNRRKALGNCLNLIEFTSIKKCLAVEYLIQYQDLFTREEMWVIIQEITEKRDPVDQTNARWPSDVERQTVNRNIEIVRGIPFRMRFQVNHQCLLQSIAFRIPGGAFRGYDDHFDFIIEIDRLNGNAKNLKRTKVFVGTVSLETDQCARCFDMRSTPFPDLIFINPSAKYEITIIAFQNVSISCLKTRMYYFDGEGNEPTIKVHFSNSNLALLKLSDVI